MTAAGTVTRLETAGRRFFEDLGYRLEIGDKVDAELRARMAARMARALFDGAGRRQCSMGGIFLSPRPCGGLPHIDGVLFSGGVSEYIYGREESVFGDLGPYLGREVRKEVEQRGFRIIESSEGIRATVIGASQYTVQLSGETIHVPEAANLPVRNLRVFVVHVDWEAPGCRTNRGCRKQDPAGARSRSSRVAFRPGVCFAAVRRLRRDARIGKGDRSGSRRSARRGSAPGIDLRTERGARGRGHAFGEMESALRR